MYNIYREKVDRNVETSIELFDEGHPCRLVMEILFSPTFEGQAEKKLAQLKQLAPAEGKSLEVMKMVFVDRVEIDAVGLLKEAENDGSELAELVQAFYYKELKRDTMSYRQNLLRLSEKHPFLNVCIAELYENDYANSEDFLDIQLAIEHYKKADSHGMLSPRGANSLCLIYDYFSWKGMLEYDEKEMERIMKIVEKL